MQKDQRHQFLRSIRDNNEAYGLPSNALDRIISRGLKQTIRPELGGRPVLRLVNSEARILCSDVDVTSSEAFGRWAIPKLKKELLNPNPEVTKRALLSLLDMVHDPEKAVEAVRLQVIPRLVRPMRNKDPFFRQHVLLILQTLAMQPAGKMAVVNHCIIINQLLGLLEDENYSVRLTATKTLLSLATWYFAVKELILKNAIPTVVKRLNTEPDEYIITDLLDILELLLDQDMDAKKRCLDSKGMELVILLGELSTAKVRARATAVLTQLLKHPDGNAAMLCYRNDILYLLTDLLEEEDLSVRTNAAAALMYALRVTEAKLRCSQLSTMRRLLACSQLHLAPTLQLNAIQALTCLAEVPQCRTALKSDLALVQNIRPADSIARRHKNILLTVINKVV